MAQLIVALVLFVLSYVTAPKPPKPQNATAGKLDIPSPKLGDPIPVIFGTTWVKDPGVIYYGNPYTIPITESSGGK